MNFPVYEAETQHRDEVLQVAYPRDKKNCETVQYVHVYVPFPRLTVLHVTSRTHSLIQGWLFNSVFKCVKSWWFESQNY